MISDGDLGRRDLIALSALGLAATAAPALAQGGARVRPGETGPGVPLVTAVVSCPAGRFQGLKSDGISHCRGIRYGEAPVGPLR